MNPSYHPEVPPIEINEAKVSCGTQVASIRDDSKLQIVSHLNSPKCEGGAAGAQITLVPRLLD